MPLDNEDALRQLAIMIDLGPGIYNAASVQPRTDVYNGPRENYTAVSSRACELT